MLEEQIFHLLTKEYSLVLAVTPQHYSAVKQIRKEILLTKYQSYAVIENEDTFLMNDDDKQSFIYLLQHNKSQTYVGTIRVFFINNTTPIKEMPMQKDGHVENIDHFTKTFPICEVSRLALTKTLPKHPKMSTLRLRTNLSLALMCATRINLCLYHYQNVFAIMEPSLYRILSRQNVNFEQIGEPVDYYGICTPFSIERKKLLEDTEEIMGRVTRHYLQKICDDPKSFWQFIDNNPYLKPSDIQLQKICELLGKYDEDIALSHSL